jgi:release factor glutamine methyltransferase
MIAKIKNVAYEKIVFDSQNVFLNDREESLFLKMLDRYEKNEPISKIINEKSFWKSEFFIDANVLDPRPETELIIEAIVERFDKKSALNFLDVGTGSGCILLSLALEYPNSRGVGIDVSPAAVEVAKRNCEELLRSSLQGGHSSTRESGALRRFASRNDVYIKEKGIRFLAIDWRDFCESEFDVVVSNPPYVKTADIPTLDENVRNYDPQLALDGGTTGLDAYASIIPLARKWLKPNGSIFLEIGYGQAESVSGLLKANGFAIDEIKKDYSGIERVVIARCLSSRSF